MFIDVSNKDKDGGFFNGLRVNSSCITKYRPHLNKQGHKDGTVLYLTTGESFVIKESVEDIDKKLK